MKYRSPAALHQAIKHRIRLISKSEGIEALRLRRHLAFERFLARIFKHPSSPWVLKGGYAMELRIKSSRATRDIDLAVPESNLSVLEHREISTNVYEQITKLLDNNLGDFFSFKVEEKYDDIISPPFGGQVSCPLTPSLSDPKELRTLPSLVSDASFVSYPRRESRDANALRYASPLTPAVIGYETCTSPTRDGGVLKQSLVF